MPNLNIQRNFGGAIDWFMYDLANDQLIISPIVPGDISDSKAIVISETTVPGQDYAPVHSSGTGNRKISFTIPIIQRNNYTGNTIQLNYFKSLRHRVDGGGRNGRRTPQVLYYWGTGSAPMVYWVTRCDFNHRQGWINSIGAPMITDVSIELWLDPTHDITAMEEEFREFSESLGGVVPALDIAASGASVRRY